jgi:RNA polymerase sigma factor (sigma-70 family)
MARAQLGDALHQIERLFSKGTLSGFSDAALLRRFVADRDEEAFGGLLARHGPMVLSVCRSLLHDQYNVEDAFQATFLVLIRRASALWVDDSLGGWLHRVAHRVALRARADAVRRRAREHSAIDIDACKDQAGATEHYLNEELHEEIARLPVSYRRAVVLCYLEGMTQVQAAHQLGCGEATLRRRLAGARRRLQSGLLGRGSAPEHTISLSPFVPLSPVPPPWIDAALRAAAVAASGRAPTTSAGLLAGIVIKALNRAWWAPAATVLALCMGSVIAVVVGANFSSTRAPGAGLPGDARVRPAQTAAQKAQTPVQEHWVHIRYDDGLQRWVCLENARELWRAGDSAGLRDPASNSELTYRGKASIERRDNAIWAAGEKRTDTGELLARAGVEIPDFDKIKPGRASEIQRKEFPVFFDYEIETVDGRRCLRIDRYTRDTLGASRIDEQTWVDMATRRPRRRRELLQAALQAQLKRDFRTSEFEYTTRGPADLFALGVPAATSIVDENTLNQPDQPEAIRRILDGAAAALERLPLDYRVLLEDERRLELYYWSSARQFMRDWCDMVRGKDGSKVYGDPRPRLFFADNWDRSDMPHELVRALNADPLAELPVSKLVPWFPFKQSVNVQVRDGNREFRLTRFVANAGNPRPVQLHVRQDQSPELPRPIQDLWPFLQSGRFLKIGQSKPGTPERQIALTAEYDTIRFLWHCDPDHDFIAVRQVDWRKSDGKWVLNTDWNAARFQELPGGQKYVSAWTGRRHVRVRGIDTAGKPVDSEEDQNVTKRLDITPLTSDQFPLGIFTGDTQLEAARKEGAKITVD